MSTSKESLIAALRTIVIAAYLIYAPYYLYWRLGTFNPDALIFSWTIWLAELFGYLTAVLHVFMVARLTSPVAPPAPDGLRVDVFVTTYNESVDLLRHTLRAAVKMDYPHQTWLLDDGNNPQMAELARELGCRYLTRRDNQHAKAGNLNNALKHSDADFVAVFDADHVPNRNFLTKTLGFFNDEDVAFVQTPQDFYNLDSYQHRRHRRFRYVWTEQSLFFRVIQRGKDYWNAAFFCGSCAVLRTSALQDIGGFATETVTEDLHTSIRLHRHGYRSIYISESLAYGLAPGSADAFLSQRRRWGQGAMQVWRKEGIMFVRGLTLPQRLNYLASVLTYFDGWPKAIFYVAPIIVLLTGVMPINVLGLEFLAHFIPFYLLCFWAYEEAGRGFGRTVLTEQYNMARFAVFLRATVEGFTRRVKFTVTPKTANGDKERRRIVPQIGVVVGSITAMVVGTVLWLLYHHLEPMAFVANLIWATINLGLAGAVVRFTLNRRHRRNDYRFPIPLPVEVETRSGRTLIALAENVSSSGCRMITETALDPGPVQGKLFLPTGEMPFRANVRHRLPAVVPTPSAERARAGRQARTKLYYGLEFESQSEHDVERLDICLYGSDLQWQVLDLHEGIHTPISRVVEWPSRDARHRRRFRVSAREWLPVIYRLRRAQDQSGRLGVLSRTEWAGQPARLILFDELPVGAQLRFGIFAQQKEGELRGEVTHIDKLDIPPLSVYVARVRMAEQAAERAGKWRLARSAPAALGLWLSVAVSGTGVSMYAPVTEARTVLGLGGFEVSRGDNYYAYVGAIAPLRSSDSLGDGWVQRYWLDWLVYRFEADGRSFRARGPGVSASLGYQGMASGWAWAAYAGILYRDTTLRPDKVDASARGGQVGGIVSVEAMRQFESRWRMSGIATGTVEPDGYWTRLRLVCACFDDDIAPGGEVVFQGDPDYRQVKAGLVVEGLRPGGELSMTIKLGVSKTKSLSAGAYGGIEVSRLFGERT